MYNCNIKSYSSYKLYYHILEVFFYINTIPSPPPPPPPPPKKETEGIYSHLNGYINSPVIYVPHNEHRSSGSRL